MALVVTALIAASAGLSAQNPPYPLHQAANITVVDSGACSTPGSFVKLDGKGNTSAGIQVSGTWTGTLTFLSSLDGIHWVTTSVLPASSATTVTTTTANGAWSMVAPGGAWVCVDATASMTGTANVQLFLTLGLSAAAGGGSGGGVAWSAVTGTPTTFAGYGISDTADHLATAIGSQTTGTGNFARATSPTFVTPALGTPSSVTLTNATGLPGSGLTNASVTLAKIQNAAASAKLLCSGASGSGASYSECAIDPSLTVTGTTVSATQPQASQTGAAAPSGTTSTTFVMLGVGANLTPQVTGRVVAVVSSVILNNTIGDGCTGILAFGTGTNPTNGDAATGTTIGNSKPFVASTVAGQIGGAWNALITGLTLNTPIWVDLQFKAVTGGTCTIKNVDVTLWEF
jgi:hypothetical protein